MISSDNIKTWIREGEGNIADGFMVTVFAPIESVVDTDLKTEKVPEKVPERVTEKVPEKVTEKVPEKVTEKPKVTEKVKITEKVKVPERVTEKVLERVTEKVAEKVTEKVTEKVAEKVTENQRMVLQKIINKPTASAEELASILGISLRKTKENIAKLKAKGILKRIGPDKGGYWKVKKMADNLK